MSTDNSNAHFEQQIGNYLIERASDFDDAGRLIAGDGYFVGYAEGPTSAQWFPTYGDALAAVRADMARAA